MTHEELLADIKQQIEVRKELGLGDIAWSWNALRAVVELHKPDGGLCSHCEEGFIMGSIPVVYPCPTIQVIEKELG